MRQNDDSTTKRHIDTDISNQTINNSPGNECNKHTPGRITLMPIISLLTSLLSLYAGTVHTKWGVFIWGFGFEYARVTIPLWIALLTGLYGLYLCYRNRNPVILHILSVISIYLAASMLLAPYFYSGFEKD